MRLMIAVIIVLFVGTIGALVRPDDEQHGNFIPKDDIYHFTLSDASTLTIQARLYSRTDRRGKSTARVILWPSDEDGKSLLRGLWISRQWITCRRRNPITHW